MVGLLLPRVSFLRWRGGTELAQIRWRSGLLLPMRALPGLRQAQ